jgi:hypothetical protein
MLINIVVLILFEVFLDIRKLFVAADVGCLPLRNLMQVVVIVSRKIAFMVIIEPDMIVLLDMRRFERSVSR